MNKTKTTHSLIWIFLITVIFLLSASMLFSLISISILIFYQEKDYGSLIPILIPFPILIMLYSQHSSQCSFVAVMEKGLKIRQPLKFRVILLSWEDIHGYSTSVIRYGTALSSWPSPSQSKSVVIYPKKSPPIELLELYNFNLNKTFGSFRSRMKSLGGEPYDMGFFKRKYRFRVDKF